MKKTTIIRFGSVCSGIEAASVALVPLGSWFAEIAPFPCQVLSHHYPNVKNFGDMTTIADRVLSGEVEAPDILIGGTPCQSFSVAGPRGGLTDSRGQLTLHYVKILEAIDAVRCRDGRCPAVAVWENVPGVLSDPKGKLGNPFGHLLGWLLGEPSPLAIHRNRWPRAGVVSSEKRTAVWRVLDAKYFGVPQRRERVFLVAGSPGADVARIAGVLLEQKNEGRDPEKGRGEREEAAGGDGKGTACVTPAGLDPGEAQPATQSGGATDSSTGQASGSQVAAHGKSAEASPGGTPVPNSCDDSPVLYENHAQDSRVTECPEFAPTVTRKFGTGGNNTPLVRHRQVVRKLTPGECERLQGLPAGYTLIPIGKKMAGDSHRYQAVGNAFAVPVVRWIGKRLAMKPGYVDYSLLEWVLFGCLIVKLLCMLYCD